MQTLDRYLVRQFLVNFVILLFVLTSLFVLIDVVVNLDEYLDAGWRVALREAGVVQGDTVFVGETELEWGWEPSGL